MAETFYDRMASYLEAIDLSTLPPPEMIEKLSYDAVFTEMLQEFVNRNPDYTILLESDPAVKVLEVQSYREHIMRQDFNDRATQLLLAYATKNNLEAVAAFYGVYRQLVTAENLDTFPPTKARYESDTRLRERARLAPQTWSSAGPIGAYLFHAYTAHAQVEHVAIYNAASGLVSPGTVLVVPLIEDGADATTVINAVRTRLTRDDIKPLTDSVVIRQAQPFEFDIDADAYTRYGPDLDVVRAQARERLLAYVKEHRKVGSIIPYSGIVGAIHGYNTPITKAIVRTPAANTDVQPGLTKYPKLKNFSLGVYNG